MQRIGVNIGISRYFKEKARASLLKKRAKFTLIHTQLIPTSFWSLFPSEG